MDFIFNAVISFWIEFVNFTCIIISKDIFYEFFKLCTLFNQCIAVFYCSISVIFQTFISIGLIIGGFSKFGLERHNGKAHKYAFDTARLTAEAERASRLLHLPVYGGDCIVEPDGSFYFIDFNDWPSFSCCREAASAAIAARVLRAIEHNESFRNYEQQPGSDIQVAGYGRMA